MHTPIQFYVTLPFDLFRLGRKSKAKFDYIRANPPRADEETWDVKVYEKNGVDFVDSKSGGLSLFNYRNPKFGTLWWKLPAKSKMPNADLCLFDESIRILKRPFDISSTILAMFFVASPNTGKFGPHVSASRHTTFSCLVSMVSVVFSCPQPLSNNTEVTKLAIINFIDLPF